MPIVSAQPIIYIEDIIVVLIVIAFIMRRLTRLSKDAPWVVR